jgi:ABC-type anion transport system duplicated permease subunit
VKIALSILGLVLMLPILLVIAIALGPVAVGILCAVGFGLIIFVVWNAAIALGMAARSVERRAFQHQHHVHT